MTEEGLLFRCKRCPHSERKVLPPIKKKIIYIDQFALSKMVKNASDPFWQELHARLHSLVSNDIVICPYSLIHIEESNYDVVLRDDLKKMYRSIAGTDQFRTPEDVQKRQLSNSLVAYLGGKEFVPTDLSPDDAFEKNPHRWSDIYHIHADFPYNDALIDGLRQDKESSHERMKNLYERWRANPPSFQQQALAEANQYKQQIAAYRLWAANDPARCLFNHRMMHVIDWLASKIKRLRPNENDPIGLLENFIDTPHFRETPYVFLHCHAWAHIAVSACSPKGGRKPRASDNYDATVLAVYAPYCDAMFIDGGFRAIATDKRIDCEKRYGTKVFSEQVRDDLIEYLNDVGKSVAAEHWETRRFIFGQN